VRTVTLALTLLLLATAGWSVAHADTLEEQARHVAKQLQCPVCNGSSVADSPSDLAGQMRGIIRSKLEAGESEDEIIAYFVERYGDSILMEPPRRGIGLVVWLAPLGILAAGALVLVTILRGWIRPRWSVAVAPAAPDPAYRNGVASRNGAASAHGPGGTSTLDRVTAEFERYRRES
jgi:cytochrome c-type biogenesis protein CcmH